MLLLDVSDATAAAVGDAVGIVDVSMLASSNEVAAVLELVDDDIFVELADIDVELGLGKGRM